MCLLFLYLLTQYFQTEDISPLPWSNLYGYKQRTADFFVFRFLACNGKKEHKTQNYNLLAICAATILPVLTTVDHGRTHHATNSFSSGPSNFLAASSL
mmetsp:Transcript_25616/g.39319  ORF Transcript_25616/g.39319 Transcript_25616/m.39319 type:complete len:98 (+) Transcript_25616:56-349(+)